MDGEERNSVSNTCRRPGFPLETGKLREIFAIRETSGNFKILRESQGKVREFWSSQGNVSENEIRKY